MSQITAKSVSDLTSAVLAQARMVYRIGAIDRKSRKHITPMELSANLNTEVTMEMVAAANKQHKLDCDETKREFSELNRGLIDAWVKLIPENATPGSKLRIERIVARIVRLNKAVDPEVLAKDIAAVCKMNY